jgi:chemotaxis signal transduction protein
MRPLPVRHIAGVPAFVSGVALIRGNTVPVVDTANLLGSTSAGVTRFVTLAVGSRHVALAVDSVVGVRPLDSEEVLAPLLDAVAADVVSAVGTLDAELLLVLHGSRLLSAEMWTAVLHAQDS